MGMEEFFPFRTDFYHLEQPFFPFRTDFFHIEKTLFRIKFFFSKWSILFSEIQRIFSESTAPHISLIFTDYFPFRPDYSPFRPDFFHKVKQKSW
jgi:hypothetical protein